jgi:hypothetical protein
VRPSPALQRKERKGGWKEDRKEEKKEGRKRNHKFTPITSNYNLTPKSPGENPGSSGEKNEKEAIGHRGPSSLCHLLVLPPKA